MQTRKLPLKFPPSESDQNKSIPQHSYTQQKHKQQNTAQKNNHTFCIAPTKPRNRSNNATQKLLLLPSARDLGSDDTVCKWNTRNSSGTLSCCLLTTEGPFVGNFLIPLDGPDLVDGLDVRRQPAVYTQHALIYDLHVHTNTLPSEITSHYLNGLQAFSCWTSWVVECFSASISSAVIFMQKNFFFRHYIFQLPNFNCSLPLPPFTHYHLL